MASILMKLQHLEYPECSKEALSYLERMFSSESHRVIPGIKGNNENIASEVAQEYIVEMSRKKGHKSKKLTSVHELQLLEMVCSTLQEAQEHSCFGIFSAIFGGHVELAKITLMMKLVSMAISINCGPVLGCTALWMQEQGSQSQAVCDLAQRLVEDFCLLFPNVSTAFKNLPKVSSLFTCNLITALTTIYTYTDSCKCPPQGLLECIVEWIADDPCLCSDSVRLVRIRSNFTCPVGGLVRWCILGPLFTSSALKEFKYENSTHSDLFKTIGGDLGKLTMLFSRLHFGMLLSLQAYQSMELKENLFTCADLYIVTKTLAAYFKNGSCSENVLQLIHTAVDRLAQTVQVALSTGSLPDIDIRQLCEGIPISRMMSIVIAQNNSHRHPDVMEYMENR